MKSRNRIDEKENERKQKKKKRWKKKREKIKQNGFRNKIKKRTG